MRLLDNGSQWQRGLTKGGGRRYGCSVAIELDGLQKSNGRNERGMVLKGAKELYVQVLTCACSYWPVLQGSMGKVLWQCCVGCGGKRWLSRKEALTNSTPMLYSRMRASGRMPTHLTVPISGPSSLIHTTRSPNSIFGRSNSTSSP